MAQAAENTPERTGEAFGEAPPGHGTEAFTDEALGIDGASTQQDVENVDTVGDAAYRGTEDGPGESGPSEPKYAGRYKSVEDLEYGYKNIQRLHTRTSEQLRAEQLRSQQLEAAVQQLAQQQARPTGPVPDGSQPVNDFDIYNPDVLQRLIDQRVAQGTQQTLQELQRNQVVASIDGAINQFRQAHPDVQPGTQLDEVMAQVVLEFQTDPEGRLNHDLFPVTPENLDVAYTLARDERLADMVRELDLIPGPENLDIAREALANPALAEVLIAEPELLDTDQGLNHARRLSNLPGFYEAAQAQAQPPSGEQMRRSAYVETGGSGAPTGGAPGRRPADEMDEAIAVYNSGRDSVFSGWRPG